MLKSYAVSIQRCHSYEINAVRDAVTSALKPMGGLESMIGHGDRVLLKPNLLFGKPPEKAVTTHPVIIEAIAGMALDCGAKVCLGDSPPLLSAERTINRCGMRDMVDRLGIKIVEFSGPEQSGWHEQLKTQGVLTPPVSGVLQEMDFIINVPKLKAHQQLYVTGAVKNLFGCVIGRQKAFWHFKSRSSVEDFAAMLLALYEKIQPGLTIVDAVTAMEGMGPGNGTPRQVGLIVAGPDALAVDCVLAELLEIDLSHHFVVKKALEMGMESADRKNIHICGESIDESRIESFEFPELMPIGFSLVHIIKGLIKFAIQRIHRSSKII